MAVKVWLPLSGDTTTNNGLNPVTTTVTGTATYGNGILGGQSFVSGEASVGFALANGALSTFSVSIWVKENSATVGTKIFQIGTVACEKVADGYAMTNLASGTLFSLESGWNHVVIVADTTNVVAYVNGVATDALTQTGSLSANAAVVIGGDWAGNISDFKFCDHAYSQFEAYAESQALVVNYAFNAVQTLGTGVTLPVGTTAAAWGFGLKEFDMSGNEFDATYGATKPAAAATTPMYSSAIDFTGASTLVSPEINTVDLASRYTVSFWAKGTGTVASFKYGSSVSANDATDWHNYVVTSAGKAYVDGEETTGVSGLITGNAENVITLGAFGGSLSDFRVYAKELSADEIKSILTRRAAVDNTGKLIASEFIANDETVENVGISKAGIISATALANFSGDVAKEENPDEPVDVTKFNIVGSTGAINAVDVIEY